MQAGRKQLTNDVADLLIAEGSRRRERRRYNYHLVAVAAGQPTITFGLIEADDLERDLLEGKLLANTLDKLERLGIGIVHGTQLNLDRLRREVGKVLLKFSVENKGDIGIKLLLQLEELEILACPGTHRVDGQHHLIGASVMCERIENSRMFQAVQL